MSAAVTLLPLHLVPAVGIVISAWLRALGTGRYLHKQASILHVPTRRDNTSGLIYAPLQYFEAKKMTPEQIAIFVEERKWEYRGRSDDSTRKRS